MAEIHEKVRGIVQRVTYHNPDTGWSVLKVSPFESPMNLETVTVHQMEVFAGATMEFYGSWTHHSQYGRQFKADKAIEKKPASSAALEKYLGSGLIKGVGPKTAHRIVAYFKKDTLEVFEHNIERLVEVEGIAKKKLQMIEEAWREHRAVREVMIFLQGHGISTLFAVRIYKKYGDSAVELVTEDPYRLANDFYGIGFFSADKVALSIGLALDGEPRLRAAIRHILAAGREQGHCYLTYNQILVEVQTLLALKVEDRLPAILVAMEEQDQLKLRVLGELPDGDRNCYYSKSLYFEEGYVATRLRRLVASSKSEGAQQRDASVQGWVEQYCGRKKIALSQEQMAAVSSVVDTAVAVLTGGPGCGKTTTTLVIVRLLEQVGKKVLLAAPTGRAAQRMTEVIGREAKTLHRLLEWQGGGFQRNEEQPLSCDYLIVDECSMLDISLTSSLLKAVPKGCQLLFIGDADQLPSVGPGNVLRDIIQSGVVKVLRLTKIFRQAKQSKIISYAHQINGGEMVRIESPFKKPSVWAEQEDCIFIDSDEATQEQLKFISKVKKIVFIPEEDDQDDLFSFRTGEIIHSAYEHDFVVPDKFKHIDLQKLRAAQGEIEELRAVVAKIHPWSSLNYGLTAVESVVRLYLEWIPKYYGSGSEIQILSPMIRGTLGTLNLNRVIQQRANPEAPGKPQIIVGERIFRQGDRVIHKRNNYDLAVFNGDIGRIVTIDSARLTLVVAFSGDGREVLYQKDDIVELDLAYAITIHKSQGSEFEAVILPVLTQHFKMLFRNLIYTGLTRAKKLAVVVGTRKALAMAIRQEDTAKRQTALPYLLNQGV